MNKRTVQNKRKYIVYVGRTMTTRNTTMEPETPETSSDHGIGKKIHYGNTDNLVRRMPNQNSLNVDLIFY